MTFFKSVAMLSVVVVALAQVATGASIEQRLTVVSNAKTVGGVFQVAVQVKGTDLPAANTLGSATIDVQFDNTKLTYVNATWGIASGLGYSRTVTNNGTYIRVGLLGFSVNESGGGDPPGYDVGTSYATWIQLNFTLATDEGTSGLTIDPGSNAIGLFQNHSNEPATGTIIDQTLTPPINIVDEPLPIQLASFSAQVGSMGGEVLLQWSTLSETNNYGFTVQRKGAADGDFGDVEGSFIAGHGTTVEPQSYGYTDRPASPGTYFYRLKQQDMDGTVHYTQSVQVVVSLTDVAETAPKVFQLHQNYPNPFNPTTQIRFTVESASQTTLRVYNTVGQEVAVLFDGPAQAGQYYTVTLDAHDLASGVYLYRLVSGDRSEIKRLVLVK